MKRLIVIISILLAVPAFSETYYVSPMGTAANKAAATDGPCTTNANCMSLTVYAGETFSTGDVIVRCHTPLSGIKPIFDIFKDVSITLSLVPNNALKTSDGKYFKVDGGYFIVQ